MISVNSCHFHLSAETEPKHLLKKKDKSGFHNFARWYFSLKIQLGIKDLMLRSMLCHIVILMKNLLLKTGKASR